MKAPLSNQQLLNRSLKIWAMTNLGATVVIMVLSLLVALIRLQVEPLSGIPMALLILLIGGLMSLPVVAIVYYVLRLFVYTDITRLTKTAIAVAVPLMAAILIATAVRSFDSPGFSRPDADSLKFLGLHTLAGIAAILYYTRDLRRTAPDDSENTPL